MGAIVVTTTGLAHMASLLDTEDAMKYLAWGTGTTEALVGDTGLQTPAAPTAANAVAGAISIATEATTGDTMKVVGTITATQTAAITEVIICNQSALSGASTFLRSTFDPINVNSGDSIEFTILVTFGNDMGGYVG